MALHCWRFWRQPALWQGRPKSLSHSQRSDQRLRALCPRLPPIPTSLQGFGSRCALFALTALQGSKFKSVPVCVIMRKGGNTHRVRMRAAQVAVLFDRWAAISDEQPSEKVHAPFVSLLQQSGFLKVILLMP